MMEKLTQDMADAAWAIIEEVEALGGMTKAVDCGWAKLKIEASAAEKQARIDSGRDVIVGVNKYKLDAGRRRSRSATSTTCRCATAQIARLKAVRAARDGAKVQAALDGADRAAPKRAGQPAGPEHRGGARCAPPSARSAMRWRRSSGATAPTRRR